MLLECGATSLTALKRCGLDPGEVRTVVVSHLHGDHFGGLPFLILDGQFSRRTDIEVTTWKAEHPSGAPALVLRLAQDGRIIAYTGDTAWTDSIIKAAAGADLLIAEAYYRDKDVPHHLRLADLDAHRAALTSERIVLTHMSEDMLAADVQPGYQCARDGMTLRI